MSANDQDLLSVDTKVRAALLARASEPVGSRVSVSSICRDAGVSRANLYAQHMDLVDEIKSLVSTKSRKDTGENFSGLLDNAIRERKSLQLKYDALLVVCVELQAEIRKLRTMAKARKR